MGSLSTRTPLPTAAISAALLPLGVALVLLCGSAPAQEDYPNGSPRWMYEIKGGYFYPDLDDYPAFYGDDRDTSFAVAGGYRLREWLEVAAEIGYSSDRGVGVAPGGSVVEDAVTLRLLPLHVFATLIWRHPERRFVPYAGLGLTTTWYEQDVDLQGQREGRSDVGASVRAGVRWLAATKGGPGAERRPGDELYSRMFVFFEAQRSATEIDTIDLGGTSYAIGFRAEFELGR